MHLVFATVKSCGQSEMLVGCWLETGDRPLARAMESSAKTLINERNQADPSVLQEHCWSCYYPNNSPLSLGNFTVLLILLFFTININFSDEARILSP